MRMYVKFIDRETGLAPTNEPALLDARFVSIGWADNHARDMGWDMEIVSVDRASN